MSTTTGIFMRADEYLDLREPEWLAAEKAGYVEYRKSPGGLAEVVIYGEAAEIIAAIHRKRGR